MRIVPIDNHWWFDRWLSTYDTRSAGHTQVDWSTESEGSVWVDSYPADTDVFKAFSRCLKKVTTSYNQTRRCHDVWKKTSDLRRLKDLWFPSFLKRPIYDILKTSDLQRFQDASFTTSWRHLIYVILKTSNLRRLGNVWFTTSSGRLIYDVLKTSKLRRLEDVQFTTSWRGLIYDVLKTSDLWRLDNVCKTTSMSQRRSDVYITSKGIIFSYSVLSEIFRKF